MNIDMETIKWIQTIWVWVVVVPILTLLFRRVYLSKKGKMNWSIANQRKWSIIWLGVSAIATIGSAILIEEAFNFIIAGVWFQCTYLAYKNFNTLDKLPKRVKDA